MTITKMTCAVVFFVSGLGVGILWSPFGGISQMPPNSSAVSDVQSENEKYVAKMREMYGEETAEFVRQFKDMTIRIKKNPIDACASPDGRFVIRLFGSDETIASDLRYPDTGETVKELVRHYTFSNGGRTYSCDFGRSINDSKMTKVQFHFTDDRGNEFSYIDDDADGRWDRFTDFTQKPPTFYERDGLNWKERTKAPTP